MPPVLTPQAVEQIPILTSGALPPARPKRWVLGIIIGLVIGVVFGVVVDNVGKVAKPGLNVCYYFASLALVVLLHEFGHLTSGWLLGYHFSLISIGPLMFKREYGRFRVQIRRNFGALGYAGMQIETVVRLRRHLLIYAAAGPTANFISGIPAAVFVASAPSSFRGSYVLPFASGFAMLSLVIGTLSLLPYGTALRSDGARIRMLLRSPRQTRRWISSAALASQQRKGVRPRAWKQTWLKAVCAVKDQTIDEISGNMLAYVAASDRKHDDAAAVHLERCLELSPISAPTSRDFLAREASYFSAWTMNDLGLAEKWSAQAQGPGHPTPLLEIRYVVAISVARGNFENAMTYWKKGEDFINRLPDTLTKKLLQESWQEWKDEIHSRCNPTSASTQDVATRIS